MASESTPTAFEMEPGDKQPTMTAFSVGLLAPWKEEALDLDALCDDVNKLVIQQSEQKPEATPDIIAIRPAYILYLPRELVDKVFSKLSHGDHKSLRVTCSKFEEILNPLVFRRIHLSKARKDRFCFWNFAATPKLAVHVKELIWYELAEDDSVFLETANDPMPRFRHHKLRNAIQDDNAQTLPDLSTLAATLFWLPSAPKHDDPHRDIIEAARTRILGEWSPHFYRALESMPNLDTFTSRPMPAYHVLSWPSCGYQFVAHLFQMDTRCEIQGYQRNDGLFSVLMPALARLRKTVKHLNWSDEAYGDSSSIKRLRYRHGLSFKYLESIDLCLSLPCNSRIPSPWIGRTDDRTCWGILGYCIHRVKTLSAISLCFEKADPKIGVYTLIRALDEVLFDDHIRLPGLTSLSLRDGPGKRFRLLDLLFSRFLIRYGPQLRHLSFRRWSFSQNLLYRLAISEQLKLDSIKIDNDDFEFGANISESALLAFLNNKSPTWPLPFGQVAIRSTTGADEKHEETPGFSDWANPKFANLPEGMDLCADLMGETAPSDGEDDEDEDFEPSEFSDSSDSDIDLELDSDDDLDDDLATQTQSAAQTQSGGNVVSSEQAGTA